MRAGDWQPQPRTCNATPFDATLEGSSQQFMANSPIIRSEAIAQTCVSTSALGGKLVVLNAFDSKETPSHRVGIMPCYCDQGTTPQDAAKRSSWRPLERLHRLGDLTASG